MSIVRVNNKHTGPIAISHEAGQGAYLLTTGQQDVPADIFRKALRSQSVGANGKKFSILEKMREEGKLDWDADEGDAAPVSQDISKLSEREAVRVIKETFDLKQLDTYKSHDSRPVIQKAIEDQRKTGDEAIANGKKDGKGIRDLNEKVTFEK